MAVTIHPSAQVAPGAQLGENVTIGHCAYIEDNVVIGDNCTINPFASVLSHTRMGKGNTVHSYALVGGLPQDLKFRGEETYLEIGDNNQIREYSTLHRGTENGGGYTRVGNSNLIMGYCHIAHDCKVGNGIIMSNNATLAGHVEVQDGAIIGGLSAVHQFVRIGEYSFVGGVTGIGQDLPPFMMAFGNKGAMLGPNKVGLRRLGLPKETLTAIRHTFRLIWVSGIPRQEALEQAGQEFADVAEVQKIIEFIRASTRGVMAVQRADSPEESE